LAGGEESEEGAYLTPYPKCSRMGSDDQDYVTRTAKIAERLVTNLDEIKTNYKRLVESNRKVGVLSAENANLRKQLSLLVSKHKEELAALERKHKALQEENETLKATLAGENRTGETVRGSRGEDGLYHGVYSDPVEPHLERKKSRMYHADDAGSDSSHIELVEDYCSDSNDENDAKNLLYVPKGKSGGAYIRGEALYEVITDIDKTIADEKDKVKPPPEDRCVMHDFSCLYDFSLLAYFNRVKLTLIV
jgi:hypothetical protein